MKKYIARGLNKNMTHIWCSWGFFDETFIGDYQQLMRDNTVRRDGPFPILWKTKQKFVMQVVAPSGRKVAFKVYDKVKSAYKFMLRLSPGGSEGINFQRFGDLNIPMPKLLAVGEVRHFCILKSAFLVTEFAENYSDGRMFIQDDRFAGDAALRDEFIRRNLEVLAKCHDHKILHRGFTPFNVLFRLRDQAGVQGNMLDLLWIDVASCRKLPRWILKRCLTADHFQFFRFFDLSDSELLDYLKLYTDFCQHPLGTPEYFLKKLKKALRKYRENLK